MKACPCGETPIINYSIRTGYSIWCSGCKTSHTKCYGFSEDAVIAWVHGVEALPPKCPFCKWPPEIPSPEAAEPLVHCRDPSCPLYGKPIKLLDWNRCRPDVWAFDRLLKRWAKRPDRQNASRALMRTVRAYARGRFLREM